MLVEVPPYAAPQLLRRLDQHEPVLRCRCNVCGGDFTADAEAGTVTHRHTTTCPVMDLARQEGISWEVLRRTLLRKAAHRAAAVWN